jgi:peroxiredoxin
LGLAVPVGEELGRMLRSVDVDLAAYHGSKAWFLPIPATFVVGRDGIIAARHVDADFRRRMEPDAILSALESLATNALKNR